MKFLGIAGSLRKASINAALLRAAARLAQPGLEIAVFDAVGALPLFNPDLEANLPTQVRLLHEAVASADALLIASPEYAHGVTGSIKNLLDWLVGFEAFVDKPVAVINASPRAHHADEALRETLKTMSARIVEPASLSISLLGGGLDEDAMVVDAELGATIRHVLHALQVAVKAGPMDQAPSSSIR